VNQELAKRIVAEWLEEWQMPPLVSREVAAPDLTKLSDVLAVVGPRRAGKTYLMFEWIGRLLADRACAREDILFVDFEDYRLSGMAPADVEILLEAFEGLAGRRPRFLFFDEVQFLPSWSRVLRTLHNRRQFRIVVSGSNARLLTREVATELRGRYRDLVLMPFSFREALRFKRVEWTERTLHTPWRARVTREFDNYLREGGYPEILEQPTAMEKRKLAQNYYQTIFYRDILDRYHIKAKAILEAMMRFGVDGYASLFSVSGFEKQLKAHGMAGSKRTLSNYLGYLEEAFFLLAHEKFSWSARKRLMNPVKIYLLDQVFIGLATSFSENRGRVLENVVAVELRRRGLEACYYRENQECDFITLDAGKPKQAIQVCWELDARNETREYAGLLAAMRELRLREGFILTYGQEQSVRRDGRTVAVKPVWKWLLEQ
jgi:predicted AAA+ superfamily ATPase